MQLDENSFEGTERWEGLRVETSRIRESSARHACGIRRDWWDPPPPRPPGTAELPSCRRLILKIPSLSDEFLSLA